MVESWPPLFYQKSNLCPWRHFENTVLLLDRGLDIRVRFGILSIIPIRLKLSADTVVTLHPLSVPLGRFTSSLKINWSLSKLTGVIRICLFEICPRCFDLVRLEFYQDQCVKVLPFNNLSNEIIICYMHTCHLAYLSSSITSYSMQPFGNSESYILSQHNRVDIAALVTSPTNYYSCSRLSQIITVGMIALFTSWPR